MEGRPARGSRGRGRRVDVGRFGVGAPIWGRPKSTQVELGEGSGEIEMGSLRAAHRAEARSEGAGRGAEPSSIPRREASGRSGRGRDADGAPIPGQTQWTQTLSDFSSCDIRNGFALRGAQRIVPTPRRVGGLGSDRFGSGTGDADSMDATATAPARAGAQSVVGWAGGRAVEAWEEDIEGGARAGRSGGALERPSPISSWLNPVSVIESGSARGMDAGPRVGEGSGRAKTPGPPRGGEGPASR